MNTTTTENHPKFVRWALLLGIVVILNIFFNVILTLAYPTPQYSDFCPTTMAAPADPSSCAAQGGVWSSYGPTVPPSDVNAPNMPVTDNGYCDMSAKCEVPYQQATDTHALHAFVIMVVLGVLALLVGLMPTGSSIVSSGLSYGGVVALIIGSSEYWGSAGNWIRLLIATAGLAALLYIGWKRFRD
jgi:hypothetical protein